MSYPGSGKHSKSGMASAGSKKRRKGSRNSGFEQRVVVAEAVPATWSTGTTRAYVNRVVQGEVKYNRLKEHKTFDSVAAPTSAINAFSTDGPVAGTPFAPITGASAYCLNQVPRGDSSITRNGRRFANTAIALRGAIVAGTAGVTSMAAMILVWDRHPNQGAAIPAFSTVFSQQFATSLTNKDNAPRFKILRRWVWPIIGNQTAGQTTDCSIIYFDEFVKMKNKVTLLTTADSTGLLPDMVEGSLLLYCMGIDNTAGNDAPTLLGLQTRLYFSDN